jgi:hypothetical protein
MGYLNACVEYHLGNPGVRVGGVEKPKRLCDFSQEHFCHLLVFNTLCYWDSLHTIRMGPKTPGTPNTPLCTLLIHHDGSFVFSELHFQVTPTPHKSAYVDSQILTQRYSFY